MSENTQTISLLDHGWNGPFLGDENGSSACQIFKSIKS